MNSVLVEFENKQQEVVSRYSIKPIKTKGEEMAEKKFDMGKKGVLTVANREYNGKHYVDLRYYYNTFPTKVGITIGDVAKMEEIAQALVEAGQAVLEARKQAKANAPAEVSPAGNDTEMF